MSGAQTLLLLTLSGRWAVNVAALYWHYVWLKLNG